jgi:pilus assembly protein CpaD
MRVPAIIFVPALLSALTACVSPNPNKWPLADTPAPISVDYAQRSLDLAFEPGRAAMSDAETAKLQGFLVDNGRDDGDRVSLSAAADDPLGATRIRQLTLLFRSYGIVVTSDAATVVTAPSRNHVAVEFARYVATPPACSRLAWGTQSDPHATGGGRSYGCADTTNLAAQVADPGDLLAGRGHGTFEATPATLAVQRYRTDKVTPLVDSGASPIAGSATAATPTTSGGAQ